MNTKENGCFTDIHLHWATFLATNFNLTVTELLEIEDQKDAEIARLKENLANLDNSNKLEFLIFEILRSYENLLNRKSFPDLVNIILQEVLKVRTTLNKDTKYDFKTNLYLKSSEELIKILTNSLENKLRSMEVGKLTDIRIEQIRFWNSYF